MRKLILAIVLSTALVGCVFVPDHGGYHRDHWHHY